MSPLRSPTVRGGESSALEGDGERRNRKRAGVLGRLELRVLREQLLHADVLNRTVIFRSSLCSSTAITVPTPNCAWLTRMPGRTPSRTDPRSRRRRPARLPRAAAAAAALAAVRVGPELVVAVRERALVGRRVRRRDPSPPAPPEPRRGSATARWTGIRRTRAAARRWSAPAASARASCRRSTGAAPPRARPRLPADRECGNSPSSIPAMTTTGNSSPFAACIVISQTRAFRLPDSSSTSDSSDSRSTKPPSEASASRDSYSRAAETSSIRFSIRSLASSVFSSRRSFR